jgi:regulation of enolase protein 1 (concanavalin A-like superfamily)
MKYSSIYTISGDNSRMKWYNEPASWDLTDDRLTINVEGETDFWRVTLHDFIKDNGHFYSRSVTGDFTATAKIGGEYETLYDHTGLMIRRDEEVWLKCGVEYLDGVQQATAVITREFSDWSVIPLEGNPESIWIRVERIGETVEVYYSRDGQKYTLLRQGYLTETDELRVGPMAAAPQGDGFQAVIEEFHVDAD